jgi:hypothetical protein
MWRATLAAVRAARVPSAGESFQRVMARARCAAAEGGRLPSHSIGLPRWAQWGAAGSAAAILLTAVVVLHPVGEPSLGGVGDAVVIDHPPNDVEMDRLTVMHAVASRGMDAGCAELNSDALADASSRLEFADREAGP